MRLPYSTTITIRAGAFFGGGVKATNVPARIVLADAVTPQGNSVYYRGYLNCPLSTPIRGGQDWYLGAFDTNKSDFVVNETGPVDVGNILWTEAWLWRSQPTYLRAYLYPISPPISSACCFAGLPSVLLFRVQAGIISPWFLSSTLALHWIAGVWSGTYSDGVGNSVFVSWQCVGGLWAFFARVLPSGETFSATYGPNCGPQVWNGVVVGSLGNNLQSTIDVPI